MIKTEDEEIGYLNAEQVCVDLIIYGDITGACRCAEIFNLDYDDVVDRNSKQIIFERLKS